MARRRVSAERETAPRPLADEATATMDGIGAGIGDAIGEALAGFFGDPVTSLLVRLSGAYIVLVWLAVALWAFVDMRRRTNNPVAAYAAAALIILASPVLFLPALLVHRIIRPAEFTSERRVAKLREAALEAETVSPRCPECRRPVDEDWLLCPDCRRPLGPSMPRLRRDGRARLACLCLVR